MSSALKPRLCHVKKWPDFQGYGFNLHAEKGKAGQFIGGVDHNSPASFAGLKQGDRIIECNGTNIANENHQQVVTRIKAVPNETKLLVVDEATDNYYRKKNIVITSDLPEVVYGVSPDQDPSKSAALHNGNSGSHERHARFCIVKKWHDFEGYGFNLHAEKGKPGQFIGKVDSGSPAEYAGLKQHDRIVEVNQVNIENKSHQEVVQHIKENSMQVKMLLVDHETDEHFKRMGVTPTWSDSTTQKIECPDSNPNSSGVAAASTNNAGDPGSVRLCILVKWPTFKGYGFNLHAEKGKPGQYIGSVDNSSPGECAGLKMKDKIVEVNGDNVTGMSHQDVVQRITQNPNTVSLLVMDPTAETYYRQMGTLPTASSPGVQTIRCPESSPDSLTRSVYSVGPSPRLCTIRKWQDFQGYGFNLQSEKGKVGQHIKDIDSQSPSEYAGLLSGDRIFEVNGQSVVGLRHHDVVQLIKQNDDHVTLLVADKITEDYYDQKGLQICMEMPNIERLECPSERPEPVPRLCVLYKWADFEGYGFNLQTKKGQSQAYLTNIEERSPSTYVGLKHGDFVLEINGTDCRDLKHKDICDLIRSNANRCELLVADQYTLDFYENLGEHIDSRTAGVERRVCPQARSVSARWSTFLEGGELSPRLLVLRRWSDYDGYGFNLQSKKGSRGAYFSRIESGSPSAYVGLKPADLLIEVNGVNCIEKSHSDIVDIMKEKADYMEILVVDQHTWDYYDGMGQTISSYMNCVERVECPTTEQRDAEVKELNVTNGFTNSVSSLSAESNGQVAHVEVNHSEQEEEAVEAVTDALDQQSLSDHEDEISKASSSDIQEYAPAAAAAADDAVSKSSSEPFVPEPEREPSFAEPEDIPVAAVATFAEDDEKSVSSEEQPPREPTPEPIREPTPEPIREPTPEPVREPTPEPPREPTPEPEPMIAAAPVKVIDENDNLRASAASSSSSSSAHVVNSTSSSTVNTAAPSPPPASVSPVPSNTSSGGGSLGRPTPKDDLPFTTSLEEARARAARGRKKHEVKQSSMNMKDKYALFQQL